MAKDLYSEILDADFRNHYELLGLKLFECDSDKIHKASLGQLKKLKAWDLHEDVNTAKQIKEIHIQLSRAIGELQDAVKKKEYDKVLAFELGVKVPYLPSELDLLNSMDTIALLTKKCPECDGISLDKDIICVQCGFNFDSGEKLSTEQDAPQSDKTETGGYKTAFSDSDTFLGRIKSFFKE